MQNHQTLPKNWCEGHTQTHARTHAYTHHTRFIVLVCTLTHACGEVGKLSKGRGGAVWEWVGEVCLGATCYVEGGVIARGAGW